MQARIMTRTESGTINLSYDVLPDALEGEGVDPNDRADVLSWLKREGYYPAEGEFKGWGDVFEHAETGELLSVTDDPSTSDEIEA